MKHRRFAEMNEVKIILEDEDEKLPQSDTIEQKVETSKIIAYSPLLKMGIIGGGILLLVVAVGSIISGSLNTLNTTSKIEPTVQQQADDDNDQVVNDPQKDKTLLALTTQSTALKNLRDQKVQPTPTTSPTPVLTPIPTTKPQVISSNPPPTPYRATTPVQPRVFTPVQPRATTRVQSRVVSPVQPRVTSSIQSKPRQIASTSDNKFTARGTTQTLSPQQQWQAIAEVGSFSAPNNDLGLDKNLASGIEGGTGQPANSHDEVQSNSSSGKRVLVGTTTTGKLETPIAWASNNDQSSLNYLVRVTKEVKASDGTVVVPVGSYLVVQMSNTNIDNYAQLYATAILINQDGDTQERKLPENAVRILGRDGAPLKAQTGRGSDVMGSIFSATIAGIAKAAEIQNRPTSSITTTSDGFTSSSVSNDNKDALAGFGEGAFGSILQDMKSANERRAQSFNSANKVFVIEAGKTVSIYVNQTISI